MQPGHDKSDLERAEREAKEKALAQLRAMKLAKKNTISQQTSAKERSSRSTNSGLRSASEPDSHPERGVSTAEAPATIAQQPSVKNKNTAKEKAKERRERFKASEAMRKLQNRLGKKGDGSELQKAKGSGRKSRRAAKAAARRNRGRHDKETS